MDNDWKKYGFVKYKAADVYDRCIQNKHTTNINSLEACEAELNLICEIVEIEQPVNFNILCRRISPIYGHKTTVRGSLRWKVLSIVLFPALLGNKLSFYNGFVCSKNYKIVQARHRTSDLLYERDIDIICPEELMQSMRLLLLHHKRILRDDLINKTRFTLGYFTSGRRIVSYLNKALNLMIDGGYVKEEKLYVSLTDLGIQYQFCMGDCSDPWIYNELDTEKRICRDAEGKVTVPEIDFGSFTIKIGRPHNSSLTKAESMEDTHKEAIPKSKISPSILVLPTRLEPPKISSKPIELPSDSSDERKVNTEKTKVIDIEAPPSSSEIIIPITPTKKVETVSLSRILQKQGGDCKDRPLMTAIQKALNQLKQQSEDNNIGPIYELPESSVESEKTSCDLDGALDFHDAVGSADDNKVVAGGTDLNDVADEIEELFTSSPSGACESCDTLEHVDQFDPEIQAVKTSSSIEIKHLSIHEQGEQVQASEQHGEQEVEQLLSLSANASELPAVENSLPEEDNTNEMGNITETLDGVEYHDDSVMADLSFDCGGVINLYAIERTEQKMGEIAQESENDYVLCVGVRSYIQNFISALVGSSSKGIRRAEKLNSYVDWLWERLFPLSSQEEGSYWYIVALCVGVVPFPGLLRLSTGRFLSGVTQFILCVFVWKWFYIWWLYDFFLLMQGDYVDGEGKSLKGYNKPAAFAALGGVLIVCCCFMDRFMNMSTVLMK